MYLINCLKVKGLLLAMIHVDKTIISPSKSLYLSNQSLKLFLRRVKALFGNVNVNFTNLFLIEEAFDNKTAVWWCRNIV